MLFEPFFPLPKLKSQNRGDCVDQGWANSFSKGSDNKYLWRCGPYGLSCNYSTLLLWGKSSHSDHGNERAWCVPIKCSSSTLKLNLRKFSCATECYFLINFLKLFKMKKPFLAHKPYKHRQWAGSGSGLMKLKCPDYMQYLEPRIPKKFQISHCTVSRESS